MSDAEEVPGGAPLPAKEDPETLVLRGRPRPVIRFRKGLIIGLTGVVSAALITLTWVSLKPATFRLVADQESAEAPGKATPDALAGAPAAYSDVPKLGPPLPGDLGRAILDRQRQLGAEGEGASSGRDPDARRVAAERQRLAAEEQAAHTSAVLVQLAKAGPAGTPALDVPPATAAMQPIAEPAAASAGARQRKLDFVRSNKGDTNPHALTAPASPWTLSAGTIIPASLVTGLNSDLPGMVIAQVTDNVRDSATGRTILIPQGARLIGRYDSAVAYGQKRALLVWERILFPNGASLNLGKMPATDSAGYAGLHDHVNSHEWQLLKGVLLSTVLGLGSELSFGKSDIARAISQSTQQNGTRAGEQLVGRALDLQPTLVVRPGWPVRVLVDQDLVLEPWKA